MIKLTEEQIIDGRNKAYLKAGHNAYFGNGFNAGVEFALKQVNIPVDVGQSEQLLCEDCNKHKRTQGNGIIHKLCECGTIKTIKMYKGKLISADFEESTMEFEIEHEFTVRAGDYVILSKNDYEKQCNMLIVNQQSELLLDYTKQLKKQGTLTSGQDESKLVKKYISNN